METIIASIIFVLIGFIVGGLWAATWQTDNRPIRPEEPRGLTQADIIKALREDARKEDDGELHSGI
jgi:hypothetical protein